MKTLVCFNLLAALAAIGSSGCSLDFCEEIFKKDHPEVDCDNLGAGGANSSTTASMGAMTTSSSMPSSSSTGIDPTCVPSESTWSPSEMCGVFVKMGATGDGTPAAPFGTITEAQASKPGATIYVCEGTYTESVTLTQSESIFGALDCATWAYDAAKRPTLTALPGVVPLRINGTGTHVVEDINVTADNAMMPSGSSIAVFVHQATVEFARVDMISGEGATGEAGAMQMKDPTPAAANGATPMENGCEGAAGVFGASGGALMCSAMDVSGGAGGNGTNTANGGSGEDGYPNEAGTGEGGAPKTNTPSDCTSGTQGRPGNPGMPGLGAESSLGMLDGTGYVGVAGDPGMGPGTPGQGGGGGGGSNVCTRGSGGAGPAGGGGGAGGCGGNPGAGGKGGGGSFALVSINATVTLEASRLTAGGGGQGGAGDAGQEGMDGGGFGLDGDPDGLACRGGSGGKGGRGGAGGGGCGGPSVAIAYVGTAPIETTGVMLDVAETPAPGGPGGNGGPTNMGGVGAMGFTALRQAW